MSLRPHQPRLGGAASSLAVLETTGADEGAGGGEDWVNEAGSRMVEPRRDRSASPADGIGGGVSSRDGSACCVTDGASSRANCGCSAGAA
jgi:hypothetical protein